MKGLVFVYLLTAITVLVSIPRPKIGLYGYVGFAVLRPQAIWGYAGNIERVSFLLGVALLLGWALQGFGTWKIGRGRAVVVTFLTFAVWSGLSAIQATDLDRSTAALIELLKILLPFLAGVTLLEGKKEWLPLVWTIVVAQGYVAFEMNLNYVLKGYNTASEGFGGMDNNCFGVSLVTILGLAIALAISSTRLYQRAIAATAAALILHTILLTFSRGALVGVFAVGLTAFAVFPKRPKFVIPLTIAILLALRFTGPQLAARYATAFAASDERDGSAESRLDLWMDCLKVVADSPVFGVGPWNWRVVASSYGWTNGKSAHSVWMETAAETGVPGVLALLAFFGTGALWVWPLARARLTATNREEKVLAAGIMMSIVGFVVSGQFVSVTGLEAPYYVVMIAVIMMKAKVPEIVAVQSPRPPFVLAPALSGNRSRVAPARSVRHALESQPRR